jgi:hypothetical protein
MKKRLFLFIVIFIALVACKKEKIEQGNNNIGNNGGSSSGNTNVVNKPPIANAGPDQHPKRDTFLLDGSASTDPDGNIARWQWKKIYGPGNIVFSASDQKQTHVNTSSMGMFQFELEITDNGGLIARDSINIFFFLSGDLCDTITRPVIQSSLNEFWRFPFQRFGVGVTTLGTKVYFAGGRESASGDPTAHVVILDMETKAESQASLSIPRAFIGCGSAGTKLFFAGGWTWAGALSRVEIVDVSAGTSATAELSEPRWSVTTAVLGSKVFFAGGFSWNGTTNQPSSRIDIYDMLTATWSSTNLSEARGDIATIVFDNKLYFAGGNRGYSVSSAIDIYDGNSGAWTVSNLNIAVANATAINADGKLYFAGGYDISLGSGGAPLRNSKCDVQIRNMNDQSYSFANLMTKACSLIACRQNNKIIFFPSGENPSTFFDVYDITTNSWTVGLINDFLRGGICFVYKNDIYVAGGYFGSTTFGPIAINDKVLKLEF